MNSPRPGATGIIGSRCGNVRLRTKAAVWALTVKSSVASKVAALASQCPMPTPAPLIKANTNAEQNWRIQNLISENFDLYLFNDIAVSYTHLRAHETGR